MLVVSAYSRMRALVIRSYQWTPRIARLRDSLARFSLARVKPAFHGACFGAVSAPIWSARNTRRASAAFENERFHYEHNVAHGSMGADCRADKCPRRQNMLPEALIVRF